MRAGDARSFSVSASDDAATSYAPTPKSIKGNNRPENPAFNGISGRFLS
jgi:hypothetical protein